MCENNSYTLSNKKKVKHQKEMVCFGNNWVHVQTSERYVNDKICKELAHLVTRHRGCIIDVLDSITSTDKGLIIQLPGMWGIQMSQWPNAGTNGYMRAPTHVMKVPVAQDRSHQGRIVVLCVKHYKTL